MELIAGGKINDAVVNNGWPCAFNRPNPDDFAGLAIERRQLF
jgi:hypothetical protein